MICANAFYYSISWWMHVCKKLYHFHPWVRKPQAQNATDLAIITQIQWKNFQDSHPNSNEIITVKFCVVWQLSHCRIYTFSKWSDRKIITAILIGIKFEIVKNLGLCLFPSSVNLNSSDTGDRIPALGVNIMPTDALAPKVTRASAGMVLVVLVRQHLWLFQD